MKGLTIGFGDLDITQKLPTLTPTEFIVEAAQNIAGKTRTANKHFANLVVLMRRNKKHEVAVRKTALTHFEIKQYAFQRTLNIQIRQSDKNPDKVRKIFQEAYIAELHGI